jgi:hypothetical protein
MKRRRRPYPATEAGKWLEDLDELVGRAVSTRLGIRPRGWWLHESGRPDLAPRANEPDEYAHLRDPNDPAWDRARARLRYLRDCGELTSAEAIAIDREAARERSPGRWTWRSEVLR